MPNYVDPYKPVFYAQEALIAIENALGMAKRVHRGYENERRSYGKGDTIQITKPGTFSTQAGGNGTIGDLNPTKVDIELTTWREVKFGLTDQEMAYTSDKIIADHIGPAAYALAAYVEADLAGLYKYVPWSYNLASTITSADLIGARKVLRDVAGNIIDTNLVHMGIDSTLEAAFLGLNLFSSVDAAGAAANQSLLGGSLGTRFGVEPFVQQGMTQHTSGTIISADGDVAGALAADAKERDTTISVSGFANGGGTETLAAGDSFVIAGNTQRYVVTEDTAMAGGANAAVPIYPAIVADADSGAVVTVEKKSGTVYSDAYYPNILFHKNAFALGMAPLPDYSNAGVGVQMFTVLDPQTGLSVRARTAYNDQYAKMVVTLDILYGIKCLDPNLAVIARRDA